MLRSSISIPELRDLLLRLLSISASLAGFCVAGIGLLNALVKVQRSSGLGDDLFALAWVIDVLGLTLVVLCGIGIVYAIY